MDHNITGYDFKGQSVRALDSDGTVLFVARDVLDVLGLKDTNMSLQSLKEKDVVSVKITSDGQRRTMKCITEAGMYKLILRSRKPEAEAFTDWVTEEVLPQIRKTGRYDMKNAPALQSAHSELMEAIKSVQEMSRGTVEVKELANELTAEIMPMMNAIKKGMDLLMKNIMLIDDTTKKNRETNVILIDVMRDFMESFADEEARLRGEL